MIDLSVKVELLKIHIQNLVPFICIREVTVHSFVNPSRSKKSNIHKVWSRCCCHDKDSISTLNTIEVAKELIDNSVSDCRLIGPSLWHQRIKLVKK